MKNTALIDGDSITYLIGWHFKDQAQTLENYTAVIKATDRFIDTLLQGAKADSYIGFLGGVHPTFRHLQNKDYKSTRGLTKPDWYMQWGSIVNHRLMHYWKFEYVEGFEAEDGVSMMAYHYRGIQRDYIICHIDKDLNQIPGEHFNYKTLVVDTITEHQSHYNLFTQILMGDTVDNLPGLPGIGKSKAGKLLALGSTYSELLQITLAAYRKHYGERSGILYFTETYSMVKLLDMPELGFDPTTVKIQAIPITLDPVTEADYSVHNLFNTNSDEQ